VGGLEIFWPPLDDFCPPHTFIPGHNSQGTLVSGSKGRSKSGEDLFFRERWIFGQYDSPIPLKTFFFYFLRTLDFQVIRTTNSGEDLFFYWGTLDFRAI